MNIIESVNSSWKTITQSKARSSLTMLGIVIGVMAVIIVMSVGAGAQSLILNQVKSLGSNLVGVLPGASEEDGPPASAMGIVVTTLTYDDGQEIIRRGCDCIESLAMYVSGNDTIIVDNTNVNTNINGTTASYVSAEDAEVGEGRFFTLEEEKGLGRVVVLGYGIKDKLFGDREALGQKIRLKKTKLSIKN